MQDRATMIDINDNATPQALSAYIFTKVPIIYPNENNILP